MVNHDSQFGSEVLYTFVPNKSIGQLLNISPNILMFSKILNLEFLCIEVWFTDRDSKPQVLKDKMNINLAIN